jgi:HNH endonuclease
MAVWKRAGFPVKGIAGLFIWDAMQPLPFYKTKHWQRARKQALHDASYQCQRCHTSLIGKGRAAHVHHRKPYRQAVALSIEPLNLKCVCRACHNAEHHEAKRMRSACDQDGMPLDPSHPWFAKAKT